MSREEYIDEQDFSEAVNDEQFERPRSSKADSLRARRQVEALLEERRLRRAIEDDWYNEFGDEEE
ncbi:PA3496 family putative envelope integrity protein [Salinicola halimionae]|uniref:PA3496 family putative envelope integrity protein n=1 Tax=Salinicola halimionae TaxID=1949081 RepID=UPI003CCA479B